jgi:hypothetical protein
MTGSGSLGMSFRVQQITKRSSAQLRKPGEPFALVEQSPCLLPHRVRVIEGHPARLFVSDRV